MAKRRMFSLDIVDTDAFLELPCSSQALYFHLGMRADDDGFVASPKRLIQTLNASADDFKLLVTKQFIIPFESGICVVRDWKTNNYLRPDRYTPTRYLAEKALLQESNGTYFLAGMSTGIPNVNQIETGGNALISTVSEAGIPHGIPNVYQMVDERFTQDRLGKDRLEKNNILCAAEPQHTKNKKTKKRFVKPSVEDVRAYCESRNNSINPETFVDYYEANGWRAGRNPMVDWKAAIRLWEKKPFNKDASTPKPNAEQTRTVTTFDLVEYPRGSGQWMPYWEADKLRGAAKK